MNAFGRSFCAIAPACFRRLNALGLLVALFACSGCALFSSASATGDPHAPRWVRRLNVFDETSIWNGFFKPGHRNDDSKLVLLDRYQSGKIPVVLVHGLVSNPATWEQMLKGLNADPEIRSRFQFWAFRYPTGGSYLISAADLRETLRQEIERLDPYGDDPALRNIVLIGHSMGGLVSKLQVTHSDDTMWQSISTRPFAELKADSITRSKIERMFFFEPQPTVTRVVFIATPHKGSRLTESFIGRIARQFVTFPKIVERSYDRLVADNSDVLKPDATMTIPTSVDHLSPSSSVLKATRKLRFQNGVELHSIIGTGKRTPLGGVLDGVVTLDSAKLPNSLTALTVPTTHTQIHRDERTIREVRAILMLHLRRAKKRRALSVSDGSHSDAFGVVSKRSEYSSR